MSEKEKDLGRKGEETALRYYVKKGYRLLVKNWSIRQGELDLVFRKRDTLVFVEVKTSDSLSPFRALENVTRQKQKKLRLLAELYLATHQLPAKIQQVRFDVAEVIETNGTFEIHVFENIIEI